VIFLDASTAAKRYFQEIGSERVQELWSLPQGLSSLEILRCELASILNRKLREHALTRDIYQGLKEQMREDLTDLGAVPTDSSLIQTSLRLLESHPLKALDSLYLAGALNLQQVSNIPVLFVSADGQLLRAAQAEGLKVLDPEHAV
jgi:predicted nucleic acid-binding protein